MPISDLIAEARKLAIGPQLSRFDEVMLLLADALEQALWRLSHVHSPSTAASTCPDCRVSEEWEYGVRWLGQVLPRSEVADGAGTLMRRRPAGEWEEAPDA